MRRPNKPHRDGYEDEEDCVGHYDPDEEVTERRGCDSCKTFDQRVSDSSNMTGRQCYQMWAKEEERRHQEREDAMTPDEKTKWAEFLTGLESLY